jgi:hypothetical protein
LHSENSEQVAGIPNAANFSVEGNGTGNISQS